MSEPTRDQPASDQPVMHGVGSEDGTITARDQDPIGTQDVGPEDRDADAEVPPEQSPGGEEVHPDPPIAPKSGYNSRDPRAEDHPFTSPPQH